MGIVGTRCELVVGECHDLKVRHHRGPRKVCRAPAGCDHHMKTGATVTAFARPVRLRPVDRRSTPCLSPIAPRTSSLAVRTQRRRLRRTRPERSAWPEPEPTSSGPWQPREPMLPDDRDFGPAMARLTQRQRIFVDVCSAASSRLRRRVEPATAIAGTLRAGPHDCGNLLRQNQDGLDRESGEKARQKGTANRS